MELRGLEKSRIRKLRKHQQKKDGSTNDHSSCDFISIEPSHRTGETEDEAEEENEESFETMQPTEDRETQRGVARVRRIPVVTIYLSAAEVPALKNAFGEIWTVCPLSTFKLTLLSEQTNTKS